MTCPDPLPPDEFPQTNSRTTTRTLRRIGAALCVAVFAAGVGACRFSGVNDAPSQSTASVATTWLLGKQLPDGGFEVAGSAGFETPDAILAIAENAQQQYAWNATQARNAVLAAVENGNTPLQAIDDLVDGDLGFEIDAGLAAKVILLVSAPLGLSNTAFDPDGDGAANLLNDPQHRPAAQRFLRDAQRDRLRGDREASRQRLRAAPTPSRSSAPRNRRTAAGTSSATRPATTSTSTRPRLRSRRWWPRRCR